MLGRPFCYNILMLKQTYAIQDKSATIELAPSAGAFQARLDGKTISVELLRRVGNRLELRLDGQACTAYVTKSGSKLWVTVNAQTFELNLVNGARKNSATGSHSAGQLTARMPGLVRALKVAENDSVKKGQTLAVIEAMKMENKLTAPFDGVIKKVLIKLGQTVEKDQVLLELAAPESPVENSQTTPAV